MVPSKGKPPKCISSYLCLCVINLFANMQISNIVFRGRKSIRMQCMWASMFDNIFCGNEKDFRVQTVRLGRSHVETTFFKAFYCLSTQKEHRKCENFRKFKVLNEANDFEKASNECQTFPPCQTIRMHIGIRSTHHSKYFMRDRWGRNIESMNK